MDTENRFVTIGGECFTAVLMTEQSALPKRIGMYHLFRLQDMRSGRGERLISLFNPETVRLASPNYQSHLEIARINAIRRAFDAGGLSFDEPYDEHALKTLDMSSSDFQKQPLVSDSEIRQFMMHKAYWESYKHPTHPGEHPVSFDTPEDLDYLGATQTDIRRNVLRLRNQGLLDLVMEGDGRPTEELIAAYESKLNVPPDIRGTLQEMPAKQPASHRGPAVFISHSSKDADASALWLARDALQALEIPQVAEKQLAEKQCFRQRAPRVSLSAAGA